ncbi:MAG: hypothetical protein ABIK61_00985 [candidate division WOR-3 bacterium]
MRKSLLLLGIVALIIIGCGLFGGEDYFPVKVGNIWNYTGYTTYGNDTLYMVQMKNEITEKTTINNNDAYRQMSYITTYAYMPVPDTFYDTTIHYFVETKDAVLSYGSPFGQPDTALKLPLKKDKTWTQIYTSGDTVTFKVLIQEDVTVPAKTYKNAWKIEQRWSGSTTPTYFWYADGVGMIKTYSETGTSKTWFELTSATIK